MSFVPYVNIVKNREIMLEIVLTTLISNFFNT